MHLQFSVWFRFFVTVRYSADSNFLELTAYLKSYCKCTSSQTFSAWSTSLDWNDVLIENGFLCSKLSDK